MSEFKQGNGRAVADGNAVAGECNAHQRLVQTLMAIKAKGEHEEKKLELLKWTLMFIRHDCLSHNLASARALINDLNRKGVENGPFKDEMFGIDVGIDILAAVMRKTAEKPSMDEVREAAKEADKFGKELLEFSKKCEGKSAEMLGGYAAKIKSAARELKRIGNQKQAVIDLREELSGRLEAGKLVDKTSGEAQKQIDFSVDESCAYEVFGLRFSVEAIVLNILRNSSEAVGHAEGKRIDVSLRRDGGTIELTVLNSARIDEETARKIDSQEMFEFGATTKEDTGHGQGLAIVKFFVEELGGIAYTFTAPPFEGETSRAFGITVLLPAHEK